MSKHDELRIDQQQLAEAWQRTLPDTVNERDRAIVVQQTRAILSAFESPLIQQVIKHIASISGLSMSIAVRLR